VVVAQGRDQARLEHAAELGRLKREAEQVNRSII
jgi:hypothetical protein